MQIADIYIGLKVLRKRSWIRVYIYFVGVFVCFDFIIDSTFVLYVIK